MPYSRTRFVVSTLVVIVVVALATVAQTISGTIRGKVQDSQGGVLPGVTVVLSRSGVPDRRTTTDGKGTFAFVNVETGRYIVTATLTGFRTAMMAIEVTGGSTVRPTMTMSVGPAGGTLVTVAKDVKLQVEFNPRAVAAYRLIGYEKRILQDQDFNDDKKDAGEMGAGHSVTALYEIVPAGQPVDVPSIDPLKYQQATTMATAARGDEAMIVKVRYKQPDGDVSTRIDVPVANRTVKSAELGFAAAVAEFGMLLRDSEHKGSASFTSAAALANEFKGSDPHGHRAEFIRLIGAAEGVSRITTTAGR